MRANKSRSTRELGGTPDDLLTNLVNESIWQGIPSLAVNAFLDVWLGGWLRDLRYGAKALLRTPGFTLAAMLCLGLGIGLATSIFAQFQASVFKRVPGVANPETLLSLAAPVSWPEYQDQLGPEGPWSEAAALIAPVPFVLASGDARERVWGHLVTPNYFSLLGVGATIGRVFAPATAEADADAVVISHRLWTSRFAARTDLVGESIRVNGRSVTVLGVAAPSFLGAKPTSAVSDLWITTSASRSLARELAAVSALERAKRSFQVIGRPKPGVTLASAEVKLDTLARRGEVLAGDPQRDRTERRVTLLPGGRVYPIRDQDLPALATLPAVLVSLVLLVACANVATLLVARAATRRKEIAIRLAIGASRPRLVRQLLTESLLLAGLGACVALLFVLGYWALTARFTAILPSQMHVAWEIDARVFLAAAAIAAVSAVLFGLAPALQATRLSLVPALNGGVTSGPGRLRILNLRNGLVLLQMTASLSLLLLTGFIVVGFQRTQRTDLGFDPHPLQLLTLDPLRDGYTPGQAVAFYEALPARLRQVAGVTAVALAQVPPPGLRAGEAMMAVKAEMTPGAAPADNFTVARVGAGFVETLGIPIVAGRTLGDREPGAVAMINRTLAAQNWPGENALGRSIDIGGRSHEVVGVVDDIGSTYALQRTRPGVFLAHSEAGFSAPVSQGVTVIIRTVPGHDATREILRVLREDHPDLTPFDVTTLDQEIAQSAAVFQLAMGIYGGMGVFALLLAVVGLAGVTSYAVARRTQEIGIRRALGAQDREILLLVIREALILIGLGTVLGLVVAFAAARAMAATLSTMAEITQTSLHDPALVLGIPLFLATLALLACFLPVRRSLRIQPLQALLNP